MEEGAIGLCTPIARLFSPERKQMKAVELYTISYGCTNSSLSMYLATSLLEVRALPRYLKTRQQAESLWTENV